MTQEPLHLTQQGQGGLHVAICCSCKYSNNYNRWQLSLEPAFAVTTHKMQGSTAKYGAVVLPANGQPFVKGLDYVAPSRPTELKKLFLLRSLTTHNFNGFQPEVAAIKEEYRRLKQKYTTTI